ncbi:MAG: glycosyltransferase family 4 protein [Alphaproteobacteria bacterium]|nr:glycosyltransferase family 4 protein [Alphaproteobacteria bacterium]
MNQNNLSRNPPPPKVGPLQTKSRRDARAGVLHLCADLDYGDPARETVTLAVLTQRLGWRAMIASSGGALVNEAERAAVKHVRMPLDRHGMFANWRNRVHLEALAQRERPALVHVHGMDPIEMGCRLSLQHRLPLIVDLTQPLPDLPATHRMIAQIAQTSCTVRVPTQTMVRHLASTFQINPAMVACLPPGIDLQSYNTAATSAERLHNLSRLWRLPEQAIVALVPIPIEPQMGHAVFLQAMAQIKEENIYAIMVGGDRNAPGLRAEVEQSVENLGLGGRVIMPEICPDWPAAFWLANVVVAPNSAPRGQNMEILGAQALGRPVIVTTAGANEEMVLKGETAWVLPPDNPALLAKALREAAHLDTDQRVTLAENTRFFIEENFPQANWFNGMMELYEGLMFAAVRNPSGAEARVA